MTSSYRQNRSRLFLPIKSNHDISKTSVLRWVAYTVKLSYRKLTQRDISFLKIKAHEVMALFSSWAFSDKVPLNDNLKAAVWNQSSTFAKFCLRDMSQQVANIYCLGPIVGSNSGIYRSIELSHLEITTEILTKLTKNNVQSK